ncbi:MAG TPA: hypothetical protein PKM71_07975 [Candidatus Cloacimonas sp.]|nr:hypothetical protein [Candidatus Cloacimonas sp.]
MIKQSDKFLEAEQDRDFARIELYKKYDEDLKMINRCKEELDKVQAQRTFEYEQEYLKIDREYEEKVLKFDERREMTPIEACDVE